MNKDILKTAGFGKEVKLVEDKKCPICTEPINESDFKDPLSVKEFKISGMCQKCQDSVFGG